MSRPKRSPQDRRTTPTAPGHVLGALEEMRVKLSKTRDALDDLHADVGKIYHLSKAALAAYDEPLVVPRAELPTGHVQYLRKLDAFISATFDAARDAIRDADEIVLELDGKDVK